MERIKVCRLMLEEKLANKEVMYGTNTGIGEFSETMLSDEQVKEFQKYLIYNHAAGIGEPAPIEYVRAALAGRINVHAHGNSGCRPEITLTLVEMLNKGVTPVVCQKGSLGASGDLAPMAQAALLLMGEGEAFYGGEQLPGAEAMRRAGIPRVFFKGSIRSSAQTCSSSFTSCVPRSLYRPAHQVNSTVGTLHHVMVNVAPQLPLSTSSSLGGGVRLVGMRRLYQGIKPPSSNEFEGDDR